MSKAASKKAALKKAAAKGRRVLKCLKAKYGHKNRHGDRVGPKKPNLKQKAACGSKTAKAALKKRGKR